MADHALRRELRLAARALRRAPAFSVLALGTLALGIAATTAIFTVLDAVVLRPLPYREPDALVSVLHPATVPGSGEQRWGLSAAGYFHFRRENHTLAELGGYTTGFTTLTGTGAGSGAGTGAEAERVRSGYVTASVLTVLRARAALGRLVGADDDRPGAPPVVLLGHELWRRRFGSDPAVVGRTIATSDGPAEVVGVLEPGFNLPKPGPFATGSDLAGFRIDLWRPLGLDPAARAVNSHQYSGIGRLKPGVDAAAAQRDLQALTDRLPELFPSAYSAGFLREYHFRMGVRSLRDEVLGERLVPALWILFGAVALVLVIACANVAGLFLVRAEARRREGAIRVALGAGRGQLAAHALGESLLLSLGAGVLGLALAALGTRLLLRLAPADIPRLAEVGVTWTSAAFALGLALVAGLAFGLLPLLRRGLDARTLRDASRGVTASRRQRAVRHGLVVGQVALALVLLAAGGLMLRSVARLRQVRPGLDASHALVFSVALPGRQYPSDTAVAAFHRELAARLAAIPGVRAVGAGSGVPLRDFGGGCSVVFREARPFGPDEEAPCVGTPQITPGYLAALGVHVRGRVPAWSDVDAGSGAVVVTQALADRLWPGEDAIGKGINSNGGARSGYYRVVGVVPELRAAGLDRPPYEAVFYPAIALPRSGLWSALRGATIVVRTSGEPTAVVGAVRRALATLDPQVPMANVTTMEDVAARSMARTSFVTFLLGAAATMALVLSAVGLYGVVSYVVGQRRAEIGVRVALGARLSEVAGLVVLQSVRLAAAGIVVGLAAALAGTRVLGALLFDVSPTDPLVLAVVPVVLLAIAVVASAAPARRAARVDPVEVLRG